MKNPFSVGDKKAFTHLVKEEDTPLFPEGKVHPVYSTYALARDAEWTTRLFVLEMKEKDENGIGTFVNVVHHSPALVGDEVIFYGTFESLNKNEITCSFEAKVGERLIASGSTGQKILKKEKLQNIFSALKK